VSAGTDFSAWQAHEFNTGQTREGSSSATALYDSHGYDRLTPLWASPFRTWLSGPRVCEGASMSHPSHGRINDLYS
jgi:hypothetical protein